MTSTRRYHAEPIHSPAQKAAAVLAAMGRERAGRILKHFRQEELRVLIDAGRTLQAIAQPDLSGLVAEFESAFEEGAGLLDSAERIRDIIDGELTQDEIDAIFGSQRPTPEDNGAGIWAAVTLADPDRVAAFLAAENPMAAAIVCARLSPAKSADILRRLDRSVRSVIIERLLQLGEPSQIALRAVEAALSDAFGSASGSATDATSTERVADVINEFDAADADAVLHDLASRVEERRVDDIRRRLFRFEDILRLSPQQRAHVFDGIATDTVTDAAAGQAPGLREAILGSLSQRTRRMVEAELTAGPRPAAAADSARRMVIARAKRLIADGEIVLEDDREVA